MKFRITKAEYDALSDAMKVMYVVDGDGYKMPLTDYEDAGEMRRARDREKEEARVAKAALAAAQTELDALKIKPARETGDIKTLEAAWEKKLNDAETAHKAQLAGVTGQLHKVLIDNAAATVAGAITASPASASLMLPHILPRFEVVMDGDTPVVKIKDATGRLSAMNFDELQKEFVANPTFATVVVGSKASGAGGAGGGKSGAAGGAGGEAKKKFAEMDGKERTALYQSDRAEFDRLAAEDKAAKQSAKFAPKTLRIA